VTRISAALTLAVVWALVVWALVGCGSADGPRVATAQAPAAAASSGPAPTASAAKLTDYDKALQYTRCMTAHGATTPDPIVGRPLVTIGSVSADEGPPDQWAAILNAKKAAHEQCRQLLPADWSVQEDPQGIAGSRAFVECMNQHGAAEPAPDANGMVHEPTDGSWRSTPAYADALRACRHLYDDPANNDLANNDPANR
jgi:hypothetical protein